ncbi:cold-shock protein [Pseudomonas sp. L1(2025)]|uniref:cold-shock protein n=1 Tax=Pseudomonas sp. L1(2025) TaxID=3449429 RepID=UPI003F68D439
MTKKTPRAVQSNCSATRQHTTAYDEQDIFFRNTTSRQSGLVLREGQVVTYELVRGPGGAWMAANIEIVEEPTLN